MKQFINDYLGGAILLVVAILMFNVLWVPLTAVSVVMILWRYQIKGVFKYINRILRSVAVLIDILANVLFGHALNGLLSKKMNPQTQTASYPFGRIETISKALGHNKERGTLTDTGRAVANLLNYLDEDHVEKAVEYGT